MAKRFTVVFCLIVLLIFVGVVFAADKNGVKSGKRPIERRYLRGDEPAATRTPMEKYPPASSVETYDDCDNIQPQMEEFPGEFVIDFTQVGNTWYDQQQIGSMGRMISATPGGFRHFSWTFNNNFGDSPRWVYANCMNPNDMLIGPMSIDGGQNLDAGYSNQDHLKEGISVVIYDRTAAPVNDPITYSMLAMEDAKCSGLFSRIFDIPDSFIVAPTFPGRWPKLAIKYDDTDATDYIHVVLTEGNISTNARVAVGYYRCHLLDPNILVCKAPMPGAAANIYNLNANLNYSAPRNAVSHFDFSCNVTPIAVCSPVSRRVALVYLPPACGVDCQSLTDVAYCESMNSGNDWMLAGNWPPALTNITNYGCAFPTDRAYAERAYNDVSACYDYNDSLHIVWNTVDNPAKNTINPNIARLWHWCKQWGSTMITSAIWKGTNPGAFNANIAKMSISAKDPIYHPDEPPYLFCIWTQFDATDPPDNSNVGYTNGEIYGTASNDAGMTWGDIWNLTQTRAPDCVRGFCVSEHWSSLAQNMLDGDLHIMYVCDKYPGTAVAGLDPGSAFVDNPVYYLHLKQWEVGERCEGSYTEVDRGSFLKPAIKITPGGEGFANLKITNVGNVEMPYTAIATSSNPSGCIVGAYAGILPLRGETNLIFVIIGFGDCEGTFIWGNIELTMCDATYNIPVHAVSALDYYECPVDPETYITIETPRIKMYICANSLEWIEDKDLIDAASPGIERVFFRGGPYVATTTGGDTKVVGRFYGDNDFNAGVRDKLYHDYCDYEEYDFHLVYTKNIYIIPPMIPPDYICHWLWWEWSKIIKIYILPDGELIVVKYIRVQRHDPPGWWPETYVFTGYPDTYIGMMMDIDCPFDAVSGEESAQNTGGYDDVNQIAWQHGSYDPDGDEPHPEYANYYAGMALANPASIAPVDPYGAHVIKNNYYLYPQSPWGWLDEQFYDLAATAGNSVQDPDSVVDRSVVMTAAHIPAGSDPNADYSFTVIEAATPNGLAALQDLISQGRTLVTIDFLYHGIPILCGDVNGNGAINIGDAVYLLSYLFKGGAAPFCPMNRADVNSNGAVNLGDAVYLLSYLFKGGAKPVCPGLF